MSEDEHSADGPRPFLHEERNEYIYGLGESRGTLEKTGKKFTMEGRDALSYDWENGEPVRLAKLTRLKVASRRPTLQGLSVLHGLQQGDQDVVRDFLQQLERLLVRHGYATFAMSLRTLELTISRRRRERHSLGLFPLLPCQLRTRALSLYFLC